jgi:lipid A 3-O-deacylase
MDALPADAPAWSFFVEAGASAREARVAGLGLRRASGWPWPQRHGPVALAWEASLARWSVDQPQGRRLVTQAALVPVLRWRLGSAGSAWFAEGGLGLSWHGGPYVFEHGASVSRWNFQETLAVGREAGPGAWSLRWSHVSNAGLHRPNPGDDRLSVRWAAGF